MSISKVNGSSKDPYKDPTSIGNLAIAKGYATREQVADALRKQEERLPLGKILLEQGVLTEPQLDELLIEQEIKRKKLKPKEVSNLWKEHRRRRMREVSGALHDVAFALNLAVKNGQ
jgi:hypothetical protein